MEQAGPLYRPWVAVEYAEQPMAQMPEKVVWPPVPIEWAHLAQVLVHLAMFRVKPLLCAPVRSQPYLFGWGKAVAVGQVQEPLRYVAARRQG